MIARELVIAVIAFSYFALTSHKDIFLLLHKGQLID